VQISIRGTQQQQYKHCASGSSSQPGSLSKQQLTATTTYSNPLAALGGSSGSSLPASPDKAGGAMVSNPLAHLGSDVEVGRTVAPPLTPMKADKALQRVARGVGHKVGCWAGRQALWGLVGAVICREHGLRPVCHTPTQGGAAAKWLLKRQLDPNDPRNVLLLELLRTWEAAASGGSIGGAAGLFRWGGAYAGLGAAVWMPLGSSHNCRCADSACLVALRLPRCCLFCCPRLDVPGGALLGVDRVADRRAAFIKQRWLAGPYRATSSARSLCDGLSGACSKPLRVGRVCETVPCRLSLLHHAMCRCPPAARDGPAVSQGHAGPAGRPQGGARAH
jgi:hypothetical protein